MFTKSFWENPAERALQAERTRNHFAKPGSRVRHGLALKKSSAFQSIFKSPEYIDKLSKAQKARYENPTEGLKLSEAQKRRWAKPSERERLKAIHRLRWARPEFREKMTGPNSSLWRGGLNEPYGPAFCRVLRNTIRKRDEFLCQSPECHKPENGQAHACHHVDFCKKNNSPKNLITLCKSCHQKTTNGNREYWIEYYQSIQATRGVTA